MSISLKLLLVDLGATKTVQYPTDMYIIDVCKDIRSKFNYGEGGLDHGLLFKEQGAWLTPNRMLGHYDLKFGDVLEFRKKHRILKVKTLDGAVKNILIDESTVIKAIVEVICLRIGLANGDEYSLQREEVVEVETKKDKKKKEEPKVNLEGWLNPDKTLREQGLEEEDFVVLKKKFFVTDQNVDRSDPVQLVIMYNQSFNDIINGKIPCSPEEAAQFGGIAMQIKYGNQDPTKHKPGFGKIKELLPVEYQKNKDVEKAVYREHGILQGTTELNAKFRYVQLIRSLKTFGTSFYLVKEPADKSKKKKAEMVLLGVTKQSVVRMHVDTKEVITEWKLSQLRRWAATAKNFTLDFGDHSDSYYSVETVEGEEISRLIGGYIDILIKKKTMLTTKAPETNLEEQAVVEDYIRPGQSKNANVVTMSANAKQARTIDGGYQPGYNTTTGRARGEVAESLEVVENQEALHRQLKNGIETLVGFQRELDNPIFLPAMSNDDASRQWRQDTTMMNSESLASHIAAILAAISAMLLRANGDTENMDYDSLSADLTSLLLASSQATQSLRILTGLVVSDEGQEDMMLAGKALVDSTIALLKEIQPVVTGHRVLLEMHNAASKVATTSSTILLLTDGIQVSAENHNDLISAASEVTNAVSALVGCGIRLTTSSTLNPDTKKKLLASMQSSTEASVVLASVTAIMANVITDPLGRDQFVETAIELRDRISLLQSNCTDVADSDVLTALRKAVVGTEEALSYLVEKARNIESSLEYEIQFYYDQIMDSGVYLSTSIDNPHELFLSAKEMTISGTRLAEVLKVKGDHTNNAEETLKLQDSAKLLGQLMAKMVAATRGVISTPNSQPAKTELLLSNDEIAELTTMVCAPYIKVSQMQNLLQAYRGTIACCNHLISSSRQSAISNRDRSSQAKLVRASKVVVELIPPSLKTIRTSKAHPSDYIARFKLLQAAKAFLDPVDSLIVSAGETSPTVGDSLGKTHLVAATNRLADEFTLFKELLAIAEQNFEEVDLSTVIEAVNSSDRAMVKMGALDIFIAEMEVTDHTKNLTDSLRAITEALKLKDSGAIKKSIAATVSEFQVIKSVIARIRTDEDNGIMKNDLLSASATVGEALSKLISELGSGITPNSAKIVAQVSISVGTMASQLPRQKAMIEAMGTIRLLTNKLEKSEKSPTLQSPLLLTPMTLSKDSQDIQSLLLIAATDLTSATQALANGSQGDPTHVKKEIKRLEVSFGKLMETSSSLPQDASSASISYAIRSIGMETDFFLNALQASLLDGADGSGFSNQLVSAARSVGDTVDGLLGIFSNSNKGLDSCSKGLQILNKTLTVISDVNNPRRKHITYADALYMSEGFFNDINLKVKAISASTDPIVIAEATLIVCQSLHDLISSAVHGAHILVAADPASTSAVASLIDQDIISSKAKNLRFVLTRIMLTDTPHNVIFDDASTISSSTALLCTICTQVSQNASIKQELRDEFTKLSKNLARDTTTLVSVVKAYASNKSDASREKCVPVTTKFIDNLTYLERLMESTLLAGQPAKPSGRGIQMQNPILENSNAAVRETRGMIEAIQTILLKSNDECALRDLGRQITLTSSACSRIIEGLKVTAPAQTEARAALLALKTFKNEIKSKLTKVENGEVLEDIGGDPSILADSLRSVTDSALGIVANSRLSLHTVVRNIEELPDRFDLVSRTAISIAATENVKNQKPLLESIHQLASILIEFVDLAKVDITDPSELSLYHLKDEAEVIQVAVDGISKLLQESEKLDPLFTDSSKKVELFCFDFESLVNKADSPLKPISESMRMVEKNQNAIIQILSDATTKKNYEVYGTYSTTIGERFVVIGNEIACLMRQFDDEEVNDSLIEMVRELGETSQKAILALKQGSRRGVQEAASKPKINAAIKEFASRSVKLKSVLQKSSVGVMACAVVEGQLDEISGEFENSLIFAEAKQLNPLNEEDNFSKHRDQMLACTENLTATFKTFVNSNSLDQDSLATLTVSAYDSFNTFKTRAIMSASSISSTDVDSQTSLLNSAMQIGWSMKALISATKYASGSSEGTAVTELNSHIEKQFENIGRFVGLIRTMDETANTSGMAYESIIVAMQQATCTLSNSEDALGTALPNEMVQLANQITLSIAALVSKVSLKTDEVVPLLNQVKNDIDNICRAGKAVIVNAPADKAKLTIESVALVCKYCITLVQSIKAGQEAGNVTKLKLQLQGNIKEVSSAVTMVVNAASKLVPDGYVDPNDPDVIAERELLSAANAIEAAARKLALLRPAERAREANEELNFEEQILEAAKAIAAATSALVRSATGVQRELVAKGRKKVEGAYFSDGTWSDGLVSAAKLVVGATHDLCDSANQFVRDETPIERVIVGAKNVSSSTVHLLSAAAVNSDPSSQVQIRLRSAGKAVAYATEQLVLASNNSKVDDAASPSGEAQSESSAHKNKIKEMEAQMKILSLEKQLELARVDLANIRKQKYTSKVTEPSQSATKRQNAVPRGFGAPNRYTIVPRVAAEESPTLARKSSRNIKRGNNRETVVMPKDKLFRVSDLL